MSALADLEWRLLPLGKWLDFSRNLQRIVKSHRSFSVVPQDLNACCSPPHGYITRSDDTLNIGSGSLTSPSQLHHNILKDIVVIHKATSQDQIILFPHLSKTLTRFDIADIMQKKVPKHHPTPRQHKTKTFHHQSSPSNLQLLHHIYQPFLIAVLLAFPLLHLPILPRHPLRNLTHPRLLSPPLHLPFDSLIIFLHIHLVL